MLARKRIRFNKYLVHVRSFVDSISWNLKPTTSLTRNYWSKIGPILDS